MSAATGKVYAQYAVMCTVDGVTRLRTVSLISDYTTFADIPKILSVSLGRDPKDVVIESAALIREEETSA